MTDKRKAPQDFVVTVYDDVLIGFLEQGRGRTVRAYDLTGKLIGTFESLRDAARAIPVVDRGVAA